MKLNFCKIGVVAVALSVVSCSGFNKLRKSNNPEMKYQKALEYFNRGKYNRTAILLYDISGIYGGSSKGDSIAYYYGASLYRDGDFEGSGSVFDEFRRYYPRSPFLEDAEYMSSNTKRFVEYYEGLLLAIDSLKSLGCSIDLSVYDTGEGTARTRELLANEASIKEANLIIGAVQNDQIKLISDFAAENKIRYVIPFTSKNDDVLSNAYIYQVNTPHSYLYAKAAEAGCNLFADQNIVILNMEDSKDKKEFLKTFKAEMKNRNISYRQLTYHAETFNEEILSVLDVEKRNVILPSSGTLETLRKIKAPLRSLSEITDPDKQTYMITLFGYPEWQTYAHECLDDFYALNTYIYSTFFVDNLSDEMQEFYHKYKTWYSKNLINISPKYGVLGFDTGMFFLGAMYKYGVNFEENIDKIQYKPIQLGFDFERVNNWGGFVNTNIFIVHYKTDFSTTRTEVK